MERGEQLHHYCPKLCSDFAFGFNDPAFSDRVLKLLIVDYTLEEKGNNGGTKNCKLIDQVRTLKQRKDLEIPVSPEEYRWAEYRWPEYRTKNLNVCSLILAGKSSFFRKLFTNGMKESDQNEVTLSIHSSEEAALMDVLKFMYSNLLSANTLDALIEVLFEADKYDVPSCVHYCCTMLLSFPMTAELTLFYIDLPSLIPMDAIHPLLNAAENFLPVILSDISKYHKDIINLSLDGIKLILSRDDLKIDSEDKAYDLLVEWSKQHFHDTPERCRVLKAEMFNLIRFQYMTPQKLKSVVHEFINSNHLDLSVVSSLIGAIVDDSKPSLPRHRRFYNVVPVVAVTFEIPNRHCKVYLDLKREECKTLKNVASQSFILDENVFNFQFERKEHETKGYTFGIYLWLKKSRKQSTEVNFEVTVRKKSSPIKQRRNFTQIFKEGTGYRLNDLFLVRWDAVMAEDSDFFINGTLNLKVSLRLAD